MGMYLCCKAIHEKTDVRVLLTGEISDELFGYKYTDFAPSPEEFQREAKKRVDELHMYDVLRADRCISVNSLEARVPFGDLDFVRYVMSIDPKLKMNTYDMGKYLLRRAFEKDGILPDEILWRQKAAFSDAVGHSMVDDLKAYARAFTPTSSLPKESKNTILRLPLQKRAFCTEIYSKSTIPVRHGWSRTFGCLTKRGRAVTLTTPPHEFLKTTARAENKRRIKP